MVAGNNAKQFVHVVEGGVSVTGMRGGDGVVQSIGSGWVPVPSEIPVPAKAARRESESDELVVSSSTSTIGVGGRRQR